MRRNSLLKRSLAACIAISLTLGTYGCGNNPTPANTENSVQEVSTETTDNQTCYSVLEFTTDGFFIYLAGREPCDSL